MSEVKNIVSFRLSPETVARVKTLADGHGITTSMFVSRLLDAYTERRVVVMLESVDHTVVDGTNSENPLIIEE